MEKDFKQVFHSTNRSQVEIARELLTENGIDAIVLDQKDSVIPAIGEVELFVHEENVSRALSLLKDFIR